MDRLYISVYLHTGMHIQKMLRAFVFSLLFTLFATVSFSQGPSIVYTPLSNTCTKASRDLIATITDADGVPVSGTGLPVLYWKINSEGSYFASTGVSIGSNQYRFSFGASADTGTVVYYYIAAQDALSNVSVNPSGGESGSSANPPAVLVPPTNLNYYIVQRSITSGSYLVGASQTAPYNSLVNAINAYNTSCSLNGPITFILTDANYNLADTTVTINGHPLASATNTLTIKPNAGITTTISGTSEAIIKLLGADYVTIDGSNAGTTSRNLTIKNNSSSLTSSVVWISSFSSINGATNNIIKNCNIGGNSSVTTFSAIAVSSNSGVNSNADCANSRNTIQNNNIYSAYQGIYFNGFVTGDDGNLIVGNTVGSSASASKIGYRSISAINQINISINNNNVLGVSSAVLNNGEIDASAGIYIGGLISNGSIFSNTIRDIVNSNTSAAPSHGISLQSISDLSGLKVYNNFIYAVTGYGSLTNLSNNGFGIAVILGGGYNIFFNSVHLTTNQTTAGYTAALYISSTATPGFIDLRNNILSNRQTTGVAYSIYCSLTNSIFSTINYNDYYGFRKLGYINSVDKQDLGDWQAATASDGNSVSVNPLFVSTTDLHLQDISPLNNQGQAIAGITTDIDGVTRTNPPDIGADDFSPPPCSSSLGGTALVVSSTVFCVSGIPEISCSSFSSGGGMIYQWESSTDNVSWSNIPGETNPSYASPAAINVNTYFRLKAVCNSGTPGYSNVVQVQVKNPQITSTTPGSRCGNGTLSLAAAGNPETTVQWYTASTGGAPIASGNSFTTPVITNTTTYYAEPAFIGSGGTCGPVSPFSMGGTINVQQTPWKVYFNVFQATTIVSVDIFPYLSGESFSLDVKNAAGQTIWSIPFVTTVSGGATAQTIPLNAFLFPGNQYSINVNTGGTGLIGAYGFARNNSGATYPYTSSDIEITGNEFSPNYFQCFYNWKFTTGCVLGRTPVIATVNQPTAVSAATSSSQICVKDSVTLTATSTNSNYSYSWMPGNLTGASVKVAPEQTTLYTLTATAGLCVTNGTVTVKVLPRPDSLLISPISVTKCFGSIQQITTSGATLNNVTIFSENFNDDTKIIPVGWDTVNNVTGFSVAAAGKWTARPNNYVFSDPYGNYFTFRSNDSSRFFLANSDAQSSSYTTILKTPLLNFGGYAGAKLYYWHNYTTYNGSDALYIEKSVPPANTTWSSTPLFSRVNSPVNIGSSNRFVLDSIDLTPYINTSFYIRFRYVGSQDFFWAIDNINIIGTAAPQIIWSPTTGLFTTSAGTTAYTGLASNSVWANPTTTTTYVATAGTNVNTCVRRDSSVFNIYPLVSASFSPNTTICAGDTTNLTLTLTGTGPWTFTLRRLIGTVTKDTVITALSSPVIVPVFPTATAYYSILNFSDYNACTATVALKDTITVLAKATAAVISKASTTSICNNNTGTTIKVTITGGTGPFTLVYTALRRGAALPDTFVVSSYVSATNITVYPTDTTVYSVLSVTGINGCRFNSTSSITVNVVQMPVPGSINPSSSVVCLTTNSTPMSLTGNSPLTGVTYQWKRSLDGGSTWITISTGGTGLNFTATNVSTTTYYHVVITNQGLCKDTSANAVVSFVPGVSAGTISGAGAVCTGTNSTLLTLSGYNGNIQWQSSTNNVTFINIIGATSPTYTATNLSVTTYFRATVTSTSCGSATSPSVAITINPISVSGSISGASTVCSGTNSTLLTLNGSTGSIQWQSSTDNSVFSDIAGQTASTYTATDLTQTTYYRAIVTSGVCSSVTTSSVTVTVSSQPVSGTISGSATVCSGTNSTLLTLNGTTGNIQWQSSTDNISFTNISGQTSSTYTASNLTQTTYYKVVVTSGVCGSVTSSSVAVIVNPVAVAGSITGNQFVCSNPSSNTLTLNGSVGSIQWQTSTDNAVYTDIPGETSSTYTAVNVSQTSYYQAVLISGNCGTATTAVFTLSIATKPTASISGNELICSGSSVALQINTSGTGPWNGILSDGTLFSGNTSPISVNVIPAPGNTTYTISSLNDSRCSASASELSGSASIRVLGTAPFTDSCVWIGKTSTSWSDQDNWCGGIPTSGKSIVVPAGLSFYPVINNTTAIVKTILIESGASVNINSGAKINIYGDLINSGSFVNNGTVAFVGSNPVQNLTINAATDPVMSLDTLEINKSSGALNLNDRITVKGSLRLYGGTLNLHDTIVMASVSDGTACIDPVSDNFIINYIGSAGCFTVERFIPTGVVHGKTWQLLSTPTTGQTVKQAWQEGAAAISSNPKPGYGTTISSNLPGATTLGFDLQSFSPSMKVYNDVSNTYDGIPNTSSLDIANPKGYMLFVRGDRTVLTSSQAATPLTLRTTGRIFYPQNAPVPVNVLPGKFQSVGNPYASSIDFTKLQEISTGIVNFYYVWDPMSQLSNGLGAFQTISPLFGAVPGGTANYPAGVPYSTIQSGQAFFVRSNSGGTVNFSETVKSKDNRAIFRVQQLSEPSTLRLSVKNPDNTIADGNLLAIDSSYSNGLDENDAVKFNNTGENIGIRDNNQILSIDTRQSISDNDTIWYSISNMRNQRYKLIFEPSNFLPLNLEARLIDKYTGNEYTLNLADSSSFDIDVSIDAGSRVADRFYIVFNYLRPVSVDFISVKATRQIDFNMVEWVVANQQQLLRYEIEKSADGVHYEKTGETPADISPLYVFNDNHPFEGDNFYRIKAISSSAEIKYSSIVKVAALEKNPSVTIVPNPVKANQIGLKFSRINPGVYKIDIFDAQGRRIYTENIKHERSDQYHMLNKKNHVISGVYLVETTSVNGDKWSAKLIVE